MAHDDMPVVSYRILRYLDACNKRGVRPTLAQAESAACVSSQGYFASVVRSLADEGLVSGLEVRDYIDGTSGVVAREPRLTLRGATYLSDNSAMAKAAQAAGPAFEAAVSALVEQLARVAGI